MDEMGRHGQVEVALGHRERPNDSAGRTWQHCVWPFSPLDPPCLDEMSVGASRSSTNPTHADAPA
jgi:hypothetical protein